MRYFVRSVLFSIDPVDQWEELEKQFTEDELAAMAMYEKRALAPLAGEDGLYRSDH